MQTAREGVIAPFGFSTRHVLPLIPPSAAPLKLEGAFVKTTNITVFEKTIRIDAEGRFCLNDIHKAAMANGKATESQRPGSFFQSESVQSFIEAVDENATIVAVKKTQGRNGGTYATELVALRYAGWISPKVEVEVYRTFQKVAHADEALTHDLIERQQNPEAAKRLAARAQSKVARNAFTDGLKRHGVTGKGYALCTNAIYEPLFGTNAKGLLALKNMPVTANAREVMDRRELVAVMFAEELSLARIERDNAQGNLECIQHSRKAATETKRVIEKAV